MKKILSKVWQKNSGLREWSMEHPVRSVFLFCFYTYGVHCASKKASAALLEWTNEQDYARKAQG